MKNKRENLTAVSLERFSEACIIRGSNLSAVHRLIDNGHYKDRRNFYRALKSGKIEKETFFTICQILRCLPDYLAGADVPKKEDFSYLPDLGFTFDSKGNLFATASNPDQLDFQIKEEIMKENLYPVFSKFINSIADDVYLVSNSDFKISLADVAASGSDMLNECWKEQGYNFSVTPEALADGIYRRLFDKFIQAVNNEIGNEINTINRFTNNKAFRLAAKQPERPID